MRISKKWKYSNIPNRSHRAEEKITLLKYLVEIQQQTNEVEENSKLKNGSGFIQSEEQKEKRIKKET